MSDEEKSGDFLEEEEKVPNAETKKAMAELKQGDGVVCSGEEYLEELGKLLEKRTRMVFR